MEEEEEEDELVDCCCTIVNRVTMCVATDWPIGIER
jgi:hypothetical protein